MYGTTMLQVTLRNISVTQSYLKGVRLANWMLEPKGNGENGEPAGFSPGFLFSEPSSILASPTERFCVRQTPGNHDSRQGLLHEPQAELRGQARRITLTNCGKYRSVLGAKTTCCPQSCTNCPHTETKQAWPTSGAASTPSRPAVGPLNRLKL
jgi:hypothetical protein